MWPAVAQTCLPGSSASLLKERLHRRPPIMSIRAIIRALSSISAPRIGKPLILFAWELGRGLGHVHRLLAVAREIPPQETRATFVLRQLGACSQVLSVMPDAKVVQAPVHCKTAESGTEFRRSAHNYADMLFACGYDTPESLESLVALWQAVFDTERPSLIVCDHSPTVILAAAGHIPVIHLGSGFACPPAGVPFLSLYPPAAKGGGEREAAVLASISHVRTRFGQVPPTQVSDLLRWAECYPCCLPELDPYRGVRSSAQVATLHSLPEPAPSRRSGFLFGYLAGEDPRVLRVLESLARNQVKCSLFVRNISAEWVKLTERTSVRLFDAPQNLNEMIAASDGVIHHGGVSTTESALAIGRPQFILPRYVEQGLTAEAVEDMGCGLNLSMTRNDVGKAILQALRTNRLSARAHDRALEIAARPKIEMKAQVLAACRRHLHDRAAKSGTR